jgi:F-type H+-transporting ATPase subunit epsilon
MAEIQLDIVAAEGEIHSGKAVMVVAPATMGEVGIAPRHAPLLTALKPGEMRVETPEGEHLRFFVGGGVLEVQPDRVTVLADTALRGEDADEAAAAEAKKAAEKAMEGASEESDLARAQAELAEATARLEFVRKLKEGH